MPSNILVTGAAGYIGSVLVRQLLAAGHRVRGFDALFFGGDGLIGVFGHPRFEFQRGDLRETADVGAALDGVDAVVHLAAIVGDPACASEPDKAREINGAATDHLVDRCLTAPNVTRFVFASTCSNYGRAEAGAFVDEDSPLNPVSLYAELKVAVEQRLMQLPDPDRLTATALRFATVHGLSPRPRFDLTVNEFVREVTLGRKLQIFGEQFWRPYCHVEDLASACALVLDSPVGKVDRRVFGVGDTDENYQKQMLAEAILQQIPDADIEYVKKDEDPRDYRVRFDRIGDELGFAITKRVADGIREIHAALAAGIFSDPDAASYRNIA